jgi:murein DD-endopeptidase MepM/ murein hydrolase activator NlpD
MAEYGLKEPSYFGGSGRALAGLAPALLLVSLAGAAGWQWFRSTEPRVEVAGGLPRAIGVSTPLLVRWSNSNGIRRLTVRLEQEGNTTVVVEENRPSRRLVFGATEEETGESRVVIGRAEVPGLRPGRARLTVEVESNDLRGRRAEVASELPVVLEKPSVTAAAAPVFYRRGGTGVVSFRVVGGWSEAGVRVGDLKFPSFGAPGRPDRRVALFTVPPWADAKTAPVLYAANELGDEATAAFPQRMTPVTFRERRLELGAGFMDKVLGELDPASGGEAAARFARINSTMRRANDAVLAELSRKSEGKRLWEGAFVMLPRGKAEALFADHRAYVYQGRELNREWHLGVDMASVQQAAVPAANEGTVVHAGRLGIYGNCVAIDHGLGVVSVYGHLSRIAIQLGDRVRRGQAIGQSGTSGLAGGDHLHLGVMVGGVFVDPVEWSFASWMEKTVLPGLREVE